MGTRNNIASDPEAAAVVPLTPRRRLPKVLLLVLLVVLAGRNADWFIWGYFGLPPYTFLLTWFPGTFVGIAALVYLCLRAVAKLRRRDTRFWTRLAWISVMVVVCLFPLPGPILHRLGFWLWAQRHVDVEAVAAWAETYQPPAPMHGGDSVHVPAEDVPPCLHPLVPHVHSGFRWGSPKAIGPWVDYDVRRRTVKLSWGSTMSGSWGVVIGRGIGEGRRLAIGNDAYVY